jgi:hypothetical protein
MLTEFREMRPRSDHPRRTLLVGEETPWSVAMNGMRACVRVCARVCVMRLQARVQQCGQRGSCSTCMCVWDSVCGRGGRDSGCVCRATSHHIPGPDSIFFTVPDSSAAFRETMNLKLSFDTSVTNCRASHCESGLLWEASECVSVSECECGF